MSDLDPMSAIAGISDGLAAAVEKAGASIVLVNARRRIPATGVAWQPGGIIATADHIVERDEGITVTLPTGKELPATIVGREPGSDLAVLKVDSNLQPATQAEKARVGEMVLAVARPEPSLMASFGVVSALGSPWQTATGVLVDGFIRSDTTFYPGFSGGALVDVRGAVLGINSSRLGRGGGLTIPSSTVDRVVRGLAQHGRLRRGYLGITSQPVETAGTSGLLITGVAEKSPAASAGFLVGDIIIGFDGNPVDSSTDLRRRLGPESIDRTIDVEITRGGEGRTVQVKVAERSVGQ